MVNNLNAPQPKKEAKFVLKDAIILETDTMSYVPVKEYLKQFKDPKCSAEQLYCVPYFLMNPEPLEWDFFGNTLYCHAALALFIKVYETFPFDDILRRPLPFLHAISDSVPNRYCNQYMV